MENTFFNILRLSVGTNSNNIRTLTKEEWKEMFEIASKHKLIGISFTGVKKYINILKNKYPQNTETIPSNIYMKWLGLVCVVEKQNEEINKYSKIIQEQFNNAGFDTCILKGQGVARYYRELSKYRQSGDIDIWMCPKGKWTLKHSDRMNKVITFLNNKYNCDSPNYHHIEFNTTEGIKVEVHYTPSWMFSPFRNHKLQQWFASQAPIEMQNEFSTLNFNRIYILLHIYRHLFFEGIGLRQIIDYFFVLKEKKITQNENIQLTQLLTSLGMNRLASALMWILNEKLGLPTEYLICKPNEKEGQFILSEILQAGNFGQYDTRIKRTYKRNILQIYWLHVSRNIRFLTHYPSEVLWCPIWKIWHQLWRLTK